MISINSIYPASKLQRYIAFYDLKNSEIQFNNNKFVFTYNLSKVKTIEHSIFYISKVPELFLSYKHDIK